MDACLRHNTVIGMGHGATSARWWSTAHWFGPNGPHKARVASERGAFLWSAVPSREETFSVVLKAVGLLRVIGMRFSLRRRVYTPGHLEPLTTAIRARHRTRCLGGLRCF